MVMKTAISVPDATFERVERRAATLGVSRSEFYARAAARYLDELEEQDLAEQVNEALARIEGEDSNAVAAQAGRRRIAELSGEW
jgi:predicted DNA-binding protein